MKPFATGFARTLWLLLLLAPTTLPMHAQTPTATNQAVATTQAGNAAQATTPIPEPAYQLPPEKVKQAESLALSRNLLNFGGSLWGFAIFVLLLATGFVAKTERWASRITPKCWLQGLIVLPILLLEMTLLSLPLDALEHQISRSNGISVQHWGSWLGDEAKSTLLTIVVITLLLMVVRWLLRASPRRYWVWFWVGALPFQVAVIFLVPVLIDPLFNKFEPLQPAHPALVAELQKVVARTGTNIPPERMFLMKASEKTNGINAYVTGIGSTKRVVIWDTTADRIPTDQILYIFGHESGHYVLKHIPKFLAFLSVVLFFTFWATARAAEWLFARFGARWQLGEYASWGGVFVLLFVFSVAQFFLEPVTNSASRIEEHHADIYGQEAMHTILPNPQQTAVAAFNKLGETYLEASHTNGLIEFWSYSHPAIEKRAEFAAHYNPWTPDGKPRYFPPDPGAVKPTDKTMREEAR